MIKFQTKQCAKCGENKLLDLFYNYKRSADGKQSYCKKCHIKVNNKHYRNNTVQILEQQHDNYKINHKEIQYHQRENYWNDHEWMLFNTRIRNINALGISEKTFITRKNFYTQRKTL